MSKQRRWWLGLSLIVIIAAVFRFIAYRFGLPYFYDSDEPWFFYEAAWQRGLVPYWLHPNPSPALIDLYKLAQVISEALTHESSILHVPDIFTAMRFISVILSLVTILVIGLCARELADDNKAGWLAAATWAVIPLVIYHSFIAIAEPWMMLCAAVALYAAAVSFRSDSIRWPILSLAAGLLVFNFKYSMFPFAGLGLAAVLLKLWSQKCERGKWRRVLIIQIVGIVGFLAFMMVFGGLVGDVTGGQREMAEFFNKPLVRFSDLAALIPILAVAFWQIGIAPLMFIGIYGFALALLIRVRASLANPKLALWLLFGALGAFVMLLVPTYLFFDGTIGRYMFAASMIFTLLAAGSLALIFNTLRAQPVLQRWRFATTLIAVILVALWLAPLTVEAAHESYDRTLPFTLTDMTVWASNTLGDGGVVAESAGERAFDREWGGYTGPKRLLSFKTDLTTQTPQQWEQNGYHYAELLLDQVNGLTDTAQGSAYLNQMLELRRFPAPESNEQWYGAAYVVYQLTKPQTSADVLFGSMFHLIGYDGMQTTAKPGDSLNLTFYWQAAHTPDNNYSLFVHLQPQNSDQLLAQADGAPGPTERPTLTWAVPSETLVSTPFALKFPADLTDGDYRILIGVYNPYTGQRLSTDQGDQILLATVHVSATA